MDFVWTCSANIFWKDFSPYVTSFRGGDIHDGAVISSVFHHLIASGEDELSAMHKAFLHQNLPDVAGMVTTCTFFLIVLSLQGFHVALPLRPRNQPEKQINYTIRLSYIAFAILVFQDTLVTALYLIPQVRTQQLHVICNIILFHITNIPFIPKIIVAINFFWLTLAILLIK